MTSSYVLYGCKQAPLVGAVHRLIICSTMGGKKEHEMTFLGPSPSTPPTWVFHSSLFAA